jgi:hypothetical protein
MLEKKIVEQYTILADGQVQCRYETIILEDGIPLSSSYHREVVEPGQDISKKSALLKKIVNGNLWDAETVAAYEAKKAEALNPKKDIKPA